MKYFLIIWAALRRRPVRSALTMLSVATAFLLFGAMFGVVAGFGDALDKMSDARLRTVSRANILEPLPLAYGERIRRLPGVAAVTHFSLIIGYYQEPLNGVTVAALDVQRFRSIIPEIRVPDEQIAAMAHTRDGAVVGTELMRKFNWKVGERIPLRTIVAKEDGSSDWTVQIVAVANGGPDDDKLFANEIYVNWEFFDETRAQGKGTVNQFLMAIEDPARSAEIVEAIDAMFANSASETRTMNEKDMIRSNVEQVGDIGFFVTAIIGATFFTLLLLTGNTMAQSVRDRIPELGVLKAVGFNASLIVTLVLVEALLLCTLSALLGLVLAGAVVPVIFASLGTGAIGMSPQVYAAGLGIALLLAITISVLPARRAHRLSVVDAIAGR